MESFLRRCLVAGILFLSPLLVHSEYLPEPEIKWAFTLPEAGTIFGRSLRKGNGVVVSNDSSRIFVTADDGSFHIIRPDSSEDEYISYIPTPLQGTFTECQSSVALHENPNTQYAVYAVMDIPLEYTGGLQEVTSRIIAVNLDGSMRWTVLVEGSVAGSPVISKDGSKVFVSCNTDTGGLVKVIEDNLENGGSNVLVDLFSATRTAPFTPVTIREVSPGVEHVYVAESSDDGFALEGNVFFIDEALEFRVFSVWERSAVHRPTVSSDGQSVWMGGAESVVAGWDVGAGGPPFSPKFQESIRPRKDESSQPLSNAPVVTSDGKMLCMNSESMDLVCIDADDGDLLWAYKLGKSTFNVEPKFSEISGQDTLVYTIETLTGRVRQHDAQSGVLQWALDCTDISGDASCQDSVEAEFSISKEGNVIYYGDIFGKIVALQVADFETKYPTMAPSHSPSAASESPTLIPTGTPTVTSSVTPTVTSSVTPTVAPSITVPVAVAEQANEESDSESQNPNSSPNTDEKDSDTEVFLRPSKATKYSKGSFSSTDILLISAIGLICLLILLVIALLFIRKYKKKQKRQSQEGVNETFDSDDHDNNVILDLITIEHHEKQPTKMDASTPTIRSAQVNGKFGGISKASPSSLAGEEVPRGPFPMVKSRIQGLSGSRHKGRCTSPAFPLEAIAEADNESALSSEASSVQMNGDIVEISALAGKPMLSKEDEDNCDDDELLRVDPAGKFAVCGTLTTTLDGVPISFESSEEQASQEEEPEHSKTVSDQNIKKISPYCDRSDGTNDSKDNVEISATLGGSLVQPAHEKWHDRSKIYASDDSVSDVSNVSVRKPQYGFKSSEETDSIDMPVPTTITALPAGATASLHDASSLTNSEPRSTGSGSESSKSFGQSVYKRKTSAKKIPAPILPKRKDPEEDESTDPWGAFLGKLAKAEEEFFNPTFPSPPIDKDQEEKKDESPNSEEGPPRPHNSVSAPAYAFL